MEIFYNQYSVCLKALMSCNPCYNGNLLQPKNTDNGVTNCCNPCYNGNLLQLKMKNFLSILGCNPCYNGNLLQHRENAYNSPAVVILVIMEIFYNSK